jgi:FAD-dependent urate hydroxylase
MVVGEMDVVVAGAGIGGLALANGLVAAGHRVRVLERAPGPRTDGAAVTIFSNGAAAAAGLGVPLDGLGGRVETLEFTDEAGAVLAATDLRVLHRRTGFPVATIPRAAILERFAGALPDGTIAYGRGLVDVTVDEGVRVTDAAGETHAPDVLVGAGGYRSEVRRRVLGDGPARAVGWTSWQGLTKALPDIAGSTHARCLVGPAGLCGLMPAGDGLLQWWFDVPEEPDGPVVEWLRARFAGYAEPVRELLAGVTEADVGQYPHVVHEVPDRWGRGATTLVGDAAHAFPPSQAQGANQALEDAWLLARALGTAGDPADLLRRYEIRRARRVRRVAKLAASEVTNRPPTGARRLLGRLLTPGLAGHAYVSVIRSWSSVLNDERI